MATTLALNSNIAFKRGTYTKNMSYTGPAGTISIDTENNDIRIHDGTTAGGIKANKNSDTTTKLLTARTINGVSFDGTSNITVVDNTALPLVGGVSMTGPFLLSGDPTLGLHPASKQYVDNISAGLNPRKSVKTCTTANITLSGTQTVNGVSLVAGDRVLVKNQTTTSQNGIYNVSATAWTRATDADAWSELVSAYVFIEQGTTSADTGWVCTSDQGGTINTTAITWTQFSGGGAWVNGAGIIISGSTIGLATIGTPASNGLYKITTDAYGRVTVTTAVASNDITGILAAGSITNTMLANSAVANLSGSNSGDETKSTLLSKLGISSLSGVNTGDQTITLTGDITGSGTGNITTTLANSGAVAGTYTKVTVNTKGIVTSGAQLVSTDISTALDNTVLELGVL